MIKYIPAVVWITALIIIIVCFSSGCALFEQKYIDGAYQADHWLAKPTPDVPKARDVLDVMKKKGSPSIPITDQSHEVVKYKISQPSMFAQWFQIAGSFWGMSPGMLGGGAGGLGLLGLIGGVIKLFSEMKKRKEAETGMVIVTKGVKKSGSEKAKKSIAKEAAKMGYAPYQSPVDKFLG